LVKLAWLSRNYNKKIRSVRVRLSLLWWLPPSRLRTSGCTTRRGGALVGVKCHTAWLTVASEPPSARCNSSCVYTSRVYNSRRAFDERIDGRRRRWLRDEEKKKEIAQRTLEQRRETLADNADWYRDRN